MNYAGKETFHFNQNSQVKPTCLEMFDKKTMSTLFIYLHYCYGFKLETGGNMEMEKGDAVTVYLQ